MLSQNVTTFHSHLSYVPSCPRVTQYTNDCVICCRTRALTELESGLAGHLAELQYIQEASSQSGIPDVTQTREAEDVWEETTKAVTER